MSSTAKLSTGNRPPPAPSSGFGTPTKLGNKTPVQPREASVISHIPTNGVSPQDIEAKLQNISINEESAPVILGPTSAEAGPSALTAEPEALAVDTSALTNSVNDVSSPVQSPISSTRRRDRSSSMYSQWSHDFEADESDSDGEVYGTPAEGLSEVEEEDEDADIPRPTAVTRTSTAPVVRAAPDLKVTEATSSEQGLSPYTQHDLARQASSAVIERATVDAKPDMSTGPKVQTHNPNAYIDLDQNAVLQPDIEMCKQIIHLFLTSRMKEAEALCRETDPDGVHMYIGNASAVIQAIKAMMTFDADDLKAALEIAKTTSALSNSLRKPAGSMAGRLAGFVRDRSGINHVKSMTIVEKHAELVYAETLLIKAVLGIVAGGDWVGLIKEA